MPLFPSGSRPSGLFLSVIFSPMIATGSFLALFLVHLALFLVLRNFKANLLFVFVSLFWLVHPYFVHLDIVPGIERTTAFSMSISFIPIITFLYIGIFHKLFPGVLQGWFLRACAVLMGLIIIASLVLSDYILPYISLAFAGVFALIVIYSVIRLVIKWRVFNPEQFVFLFGFLILLHGAVYDFLLSGEVLPDVLGYLNHNYILVFSLFTSSSLIIATSRLILETNTDTARRAAQQVIADNQLDFQREQFGRIMENVETTRFMRHDMKHHLAVINEYVQSDNISGIKGYLEGMEIGLSSTKGKFFCENYAVNAIVNHYLTFAKNDGVSTTMKLNVPANAGGVKESDLCVIVGNLLENAVEACRTLPKDKRFIRLFSYVQDNTLTFTMENSFDGNYKQWGDLFYSTKRDGEGIGLSSVQAVAERYDGHARFEARDELFLSAVYVDMGEASGDRD